MSTAEDPERPPSPERTGARSRVAIAAAVLGAVVLVIAFMVLVSQCGSSDDTEITGARAVPASVSSVVE
jgi:hypothetical protein